MAKSPCTLFAKGSHGFSKRRLEEIAQAKGPETNATQQKLKGLYFKWPVENLMVWRRKQHLQASQSEAGCLVCGNRPLTSQRHGNGCPSQLPRALWVSAVLGLQGLWPCHLSNTMPAAPPLPPPPPAFNHSGGKDTCLWHAKAPGP